MTEYTNTAFEKSGGGRRWWFVGGAAALLIVLGAGYAAYWSSAADTARTALDTWITGQRGAGMEVSHGKIEVAGFPFAIRITIESPGLARADRPRWSWQSERLRAEARPWAPGRVRIDLGAAHEITFEGGGAARTGRITAAESSLDMRFGLSGLESFSWSVQDLRLDSTDIVGSSGANRLDVVFDRTRNVQGPMVSVYARGLALPLLGVDTLGLGSVIDEFGADVTVTGPLVGGPMDESVIAWRDGGGTLDLKRLRLRWGGLAVDGDGTLALDDSLRPIGALATRVIGLDETIAALGDAGVLSPRDAAIARISINILARTSDSGRLEIPVSAQFGTLYLGQVPIADLPPLTFPSAALTP